VLTPHISPLSSSLWACNLFYWPKVQTALRTIVNIVGGVKIGVAFVSGSHRNQPHLGSTAPLADMINRVKLIVVYLIPFFLDSPFLLHFFHHISSHNLPSTFTASLVYSVDILCTLTFLLFSPELQTAPPLQPYSLLSVSIGGFIVVDYATCADILSSSIISPILPDMWYVILCRDILPST
jgi:hypothetical protein